MSEPISGNDVMLYKHDVDTDTDIPFACARQCTLTITPSFKDVTNYTSAFFREVKPDTAEWGVSIEGLTILSNYSFLFLTNLQIARTSILIKFVVDCGTDGLVIYAGTVYVGSISLSGNFNEISTYSAQLVGSGAYNTSGTQVTPGGIVIEGGVVLRYEYTVVSGAVTIAVPELLGVSEVLTVDRGAANITQIIYGGTPTGNQILVSLSAGTLTTSTDNPWLAGEEVSGLYR